MLRTIFIIIFVCLSVPNLGLAFDPVYPRQSGFDNALSNLAVMQNMQIQREQLEMQKRQAEIQNQLMREQLKNQNAQISSAPETSTVSANDEIFALGNALMYFGASNLASTITLVEKEAQYLVSAGLDGYVGGKAEAVDRFKLLSDTSYRSKNAIRDLMGGDFMSKETKDYFTKMALGYSYAEDMASLAIEYIDKQDKEIEDKYLLARESAIEYLKKLYGNNQ